MNLGMTITIMKWLLKLGKKAPSNSCERLQTQIILPKLYENPNILINVKKTDMYAPHLMRFEL